MSPRFAISLSCLAISLASVDAAGQSNAEPSTESAKTLGKVVVADAAEAALNQEANSGALGSKLILDTPFSITVIGADELEKRQVNSVAQMFINDPSISSATPSATTNWWGAQVRGLPVRNYYIDGVPMMLYWGGEYALEPVDNVEALKGLTGFMYGFGTPGGAISYISKRPTDERVSSLAVEYRNAGVVGAHLDTGGRVGESQNFGYRVNLAGEYGEAYNSADVNRTLVSVALEQRVSTDIEWFARANYEDSKLENEPIYFYWDMFEGDRLARPTYDYEDVIVDGSYYKAESLNGSTGFNWNINEQWRSNLTVGYSEKEHKSNKMFAYILDEAGDYEGNVYNFAGLLKYRYAQSVFQGQVTTGAIRHELVIGAGYQRSTTAWSTDFYWSPDFTGNLYQPQDFTNERDIDFSLSPASEDERQKAVFASDTLHFGEKWQALLGLRYTDYELVDLDGDPSEDNGYATDALSPTVALIFKPRENTSLYASYVESLESGSRVGVDYANVGEILDATVSKQYELGAKLELDRVALTAAAFRVERAGQIDRFVDGLRYLTQDGLTMYDGVEIIANFAATQDLTLGFGATFVDASIEAVSPENAELEGKVPSGVSEWQILGNVDYRFAAVPDLNLFATVRYFDDAYYEDLNIVNIPSHTIATVGVQYGLQIGGQRAVLTANLNNLFNEKYWELNSLGEGINGSLGLKVNW